jgi:hypothetical protein
MRRALESKEQAGSVTDFSVAAPCSGDRSHDLLEAGANSLLSRLFRDRHEDPDITFGWQSTANPKESCRPPDDSIEFTQMGLRQLRHPAAFTGNSHSQKSSPIDVGRVPRAIACSPEFSDEVRCL